MRDLRGWLRWRPGEGVGAVSPHESLKGWPRWRPENGDAMRRVAALRGQELAARSMESTVQMWGKECWRGRGDEE